MAGGSLFTIPVISRYCCRSYVEQQTARGEGTRSNNCGSEYQTQLVLFKAVTQCLREGAIIVIG